MANVLAAMAEQNYIEPGQYLIEITDRNGQSSGTVVAESALDLAAYLQDMWPADTSPADAEVTVGFMGRMW